MFKLIVRRVFLGLITLLAVSLLVFIGTEILPGDVAQAMLGQSATETNLAALREQMGLNAEEKAKLYRNNAINLLRLPLCAV